MIFCGGSEKMSFILLLFLSFENEMELYVFMWWRGLSKIVEEECLQHKLYASFLSLSLFLRLTAYQNIRFGVFHPIRRVAGPECPTYHFCFIITNLESKIVGLQQVVDGAFAPFFCLLPFSAIICGMRIMYFFPPFFLL